MIRHKAKMWIVIFLSITMLPNIIYFFIKDFINLENNENRTLASKPEFIISNYASFPNEYENYYNDNVPFRNQLVRFNNSIDYFIFKQSSSERVDIGKDGWLFYCDRGDGNPVEQSLGYWTFTNDQLEIIADNLMSTKRVLEMQDIEFILFIAPNKETIYWDMLPDYYKIKNCYTSTDQLVNYLSENTDIRVVYPKHDLQEFREQNADILLYHKLDTHWNYAGGYIGARSLAKELMIEMPPLDELVLEPIASSTGDLANMLNIVVKNGNIDYNIFDIDERNTINEKWEFLTEFIYHTFGADSRKLFVLRDSFSSALAPSMATQFENSLWVHVNHFNQQQIFDYDADIFVLEVVERYEKELENFKIQ